MAERTLTLLEVTGIQPYIFGSNQLAQNIGASELVARSTTKQVADILGDGTNAYWDADNTVYGPGVQYTSRSLNDGLTAEVVYAGGGNAMLLFAERAAAVDFVRQLTRRLLMDAPGLKLVAAHADYDHGRDVLADVHHRLRGALAQRKQDHAVSAPLLGQAVTAECVYTGLPAVGYDNDGAVVGRAAARKIRRMGKDYPARLISAEVGAKLEAEVDGNERLHGVLHQVRDKDIQDRSFGFIYDFSELGEPDESSYIAVVHADGNQMGKRFDAMRREHAAPAQNDAYIEALRAFSLAMRRRAKRALSATVDYLFDSLGPEPWSMQSRFGGEIRIPTTRGGSPLLPFRPIVFGGDDITFVCDGRLGLDLAAYYLKSFCAEGHEEEALPGGPVHARAGVAIVKTHYPFSRAYDLADDLAGLAKKAIPDFVPEGESAVVIDWHVATTGMMFEIDGIREREYRDGQGRSLLMRPVALDADTWRSWDTFTDLMQAFQQAQWQGMRNKVLALRDALRQGETAVKLFIANHDKVSGLPPVAGRPDMAIQGWDGGACAYYDAIEAIDFFVSLEKEPVT